MVEHARRPVRVYPRVCGGALVAEYTDREGQGLSPRVRGSLRVETAVESQGGSIPACAGEPPCPSRSQWWRGVYPRVCGGASVKYLTEVRLSSVFSCQ